MKTQKDEHRLRQIRTSNPHVVAHRSYVSQKLICCLFRTCKVSRHTVSRRHEVKIVAVVHHVVHAASCTAHSEIDAVNIGSGRVAMGGCHIVAYSHVCVCWHVD